jgi:uncharacterized membrane protein
MMKKPKPFQYKEAWLAFFVLGIIMLNYPFLVIFNKPTHVFGIPLLILYFFIGWPLSIAVIFIFSRKIASGQKAGQEVSDQDESGEQE